MKTSRAARDTGLRQVKTVTKWIAGAAAVLAGSIAFWSAQTTNHAGASTPNVTRPPSSSSSSADSGTSDGGYTDPGSSSGSLQAPDAAPAPSDQVPSARSGGS